MTLDLHRGARPDERFFLSPDRPAVRVLINLWLIRFVTWGPLPFWSLCFGWFGPGAGTHVRCLQIYAGRLTGDAHGVHHGGKCDGTRTRMLRSGQLGGTIAQQQQYVMVGTPSEQWAFRTRTVDRDPVWTNIGGA